MNTSATPTGQGPAAWSPSVKYLLVLLIAEIVLFGLLRGVLNQGG